MRITRMVTALVFSVLVLLGAAGTAAADPPGMTHNSVTPGMTHN